MNQLRKEMECFVTACNNVLRETVGSMDWLILLRNIHPAYRADYARKLYDNKEITKDEAREFIKFIGTA